MPSRSIFLQILLIGFISAFLASSPIQIDAGRAMVEAHLALEIAAYAPAASSLGRVVEFYPWRSDLLLMAGKLSLEAGNPKSAIRYLNQAAQSTPLSPDSLLALGDAYLASGNTQQALRTWQQIPDTSGYSDAILQRLLELHRTEGSYTQVAEDLKSLLRLHPNEVGYYYQLGLLLAVLEPDASLAYLSQVAQYDSELAVKANDLMKRINTARLYEEPAYTSVSTGRWMGSADEWQLALLAFRQAVEQRPDYAEAWAYLGEALQQTDTSKGKSDSQTGLKELKAALEIDPGSITGLVLMSIYWQRQGEDKAALEYLNRAASLEPDIPILQAELGHVTAKLGDLPAAQAYYQNAVALASTEPVYWSLLAEFSLDKQIQVHQVALPAARAAVLLAPQNPQYLDLLGKTLLALGDLLNAERFLRRAISLDGSYAPSHLHLGIVYINQGNNNLAQAEFEIAQQLAPDSQIADQVDRLYSYFFP
ncbi:MAG: hypothetical protein A2Z49_00840 [Chloroflexi bacterium RBG_19FT_COMBO_56_12]|nr:MAG: hypothetical protein A2Z49_00840 [Chloroflexi bacterium RBG_19FT_COMBO_56_12]